MIKKTMNENDITHRLCCRNATPSVVWIEEREAKLQTWTAREFRPLATAGQEALLAEIEIIFRSSSYFCKNYSHSKFHVKTIEWTEN